MADPKEFTASGDDSPPRAHAADLMALRRRQRFDDGNAHGDGGAAEAPPMGTSEVHDGSQTEISDHATNTIKYRECFY